MAAGKPIIGAVNGEASEIIKEAGCGFCANAEDAEGLANAVKEFLACEDKLSLGKKAREYYETHFTREMFMQRLVSELEAHM
jgi:glycosyltransferase involved in cell wall biosynthesis